MALLNGLYVHAVSETIENTYTKTDQKGLENFAKRLNSLGINTTVRRTLGGDIDASCGQLRRKYTKQDP